MIQTPLGQFQFDFLIALSQVTTFLHVVAKSLDDGGRKAASDLPGLGEEAHVVL